MFELGLHTNIQQRINETEQNLSMELDRNILYEECCKTKDSILDLGHNVGRIGLYECTMVLFWVMKKLLGEARWDMQEIGDEEEHPGK